MIKKIVRKIADVVGVTGQIKLEYSTALGQMLIDDSDMYVNNDMSNLLCSNGLYIRDLGVPMQEWTKEKLTEAGFKDVNND